MNTKKNKRDNREFPAGDYCGYIITNVETIEIKHAEGNRNCIRILSVEDTTLSYVINYSIENLDSNFQTKLNYEQLAILITQRTDNYNCSYYTRKKNDHNVRNWEKHKWRRLYPCADTMGGEPWEGPYYDYLLDSNNLTGSLYVDKSLYFFLDPSLTFKYSNDGDVYKNRTINIRFRPIFLDMSTLNSDIDPVNGMKILNNSQDEVIFHCAFRKRRKQDIINYGAFPRYWDERNEI